jgi:hypothetical protein
MLGNETGTSGLYLRLYASTRFYTDDRSESVARRAGPTLQCDSEVAVVLPDVVAEKQMSLVLDRRRENIEVPVVVEIRKHAGASVRYRIDPRDTRNIREFFPAQIEVQWVTLVPTERKPLPEHKAVLIRSKGALLILTVIRMRHDLTPELTSGVLHRLAGDEPVRGVDILPPVVIEIDKSAAPCPTARESSHLRSHVAEFPISNIFEQVITSG